MSDMPSRSKVESLPDAVRAWLDKALMENNFSGYEVLEAALAERGHSIGKSSLGRHGVKLQRRLSAIKASTEAARMITEGAADDKDARSEAVIALVQTQLFDTIIDLQDASDADVKPMDRVKLLSSAAKNIATLSRASVNLKRFQLDVREQVLKEVADTVETTARSQGMDEAQVKFWREKVLGVG